jgi:3',5'-cyclic AMP phosphodiesterase CpdA
MKRRTFLQTGLALPLAVSALPALAAIRAPTFSFAFVTDTHIEPESRAAEGCRRCFEQISRQDYDFVIHGGDHVFDAMSVSKERADALMALYLDTEQLIGHKVHHTIGNHDCFGIMAASGVDEKAPGYGKHYFSDRFGPTYYSFTHQGVHFVVLDSIRITDDRNYDGHIDAVQLEWLKGDLATLKPGAPVIVITHIPLITALACYQPKDWADTTHNWTFVENARDVISVLRNHRVLAVLQGHSHSFSTTTLNGIPYVTSGAVGGADWRGSFLGTPEGYLHVDVHEDRAVVQYRTYGFHAQDRKDVDIGA